MSMKTDIEELVKEKTVALEEKAVAERDSLAKSQEIASLGIQMKDERETYEGVIADLKKEVASVSERVEKISDIKDDAVEARADAEDELGKAKQALKYPAYADASLVGSTEVVDMLEDGNSENVDSLKKSKDVLAHFNKLVSIIDPDEKEAYRAENEEAIKAETLIVIANS